MPYREFFGLSDVPFSNAPAAEFYYQSPQHERAIAKLRYAVENTKGLAVLVGEVGSGKTMLARRLLADLKGERFEAALLVIVHSGFGADWLLKRIALQLGVVNPSPEKLTLVSQLYRRLVKLHNQNKTVVVIIDEAQMLDSREIMEELRGLLNLEVPGKKLINFVLCGLSELDQSLAIDEPLRNRVAVRLSLKPLDADSVAAYVRHRLDKAGAGGREIFEQAALESIARYSGGLPRRINTICDNALFEAALMKRLPIDAGLIGEVASELGIVSEPPVEPDDAPAQNDPPPDDDLADIDELLNELDRY